MLALTSQMNAQRCSSFSYQQEQLKKDISLAGKMNAIENFTRQHIINAQNNTAARLEGTVIKIPVVVHNLYHLPSEKITDAQVQSQITALNNYFRRQHEDTTNTPARFKPLAADCEIEFQLAISDPRRRSTTGIIRKYTPIVRWEADDKMKFSSEMGDDAWDPKSYLNIWVCNLCISYFFGGKMVKNMYDYRYFDNSAFQSCCGVILCIYNMLPGEGFYSIHFTCQ